MSNVYPFKPAHAFDNCPACFENFDINFKCEHCGSGHAKPSMLLADQVGVALDKPQSYRYANYLISTAAKIYELRGFIQVKIEHPKFDTVTDAHQWARDNLELIEL